MALSTSTTPRQATRVLVVLLGGLAGSAFRLTAGEAIGWAPGGWPMATLAVNVMGAGLLAAYLVRHQAAPARWWSLDFWAIGVLGSFTTFSAVSLETVQLLDGGQVVAGVSYACVAPVLGLAAAWMGDRLGGVR